MVYPTPSSLFVPALRYPHEAVVSVKVFRAGVEITPMRFTQWGRGLPITDGGSVTIDVTSNIRRTLSITCADPALTPEFAQDLLAPFGTELAVARGIKYPNGLIDWVPVGRFRIDSASVVQSGQPGQATGVDIVATDRSAYLVDGRFFIPQKSVATTVIGEMKRLIDNVMPSGTLPTIDLSGLTNPMVKTVYEQDRAGAVATLATSISCEWFMDPDGVPTIRHLKKPSDPAAWTIDAGMQGVLLDATPVVDRSNIYNAVIVTGETTDGSPAGWAIRSDDNPASPTFYGGPFGKKVVFFNSPAAGNNIQCQSIAAEMLSRYTGSGWTITLDSMVNPLLEGGDVLTVILADGRIQKHLIDQITMPLDVSNPMSITTHSYDPGGDQ